jgi:hypothetical protein
MSVQIDHLPGGTDPMPKKLSAIEQRREQLVDQVERLRQRLTSKTRKDYRSDLQYERWRAQSKALIDDLIGELSVLDAPGEYDQLPPAVVAEELGTSTAKVRLLIKGGEILCSGKPAHEYVSREELAAACEAGMKELMQRLGQEAGAVFEESVEYFRQGQLQSAERACRRLIARESIVGIYALPYELALLLVKAELDEVNARLRYIGRVEDTVRVHLLHNSRRLISGVTLQNTAMKAIAERLLQEDETSNPKVLGQNLDELQQLAMFITAVVFGEIERRWAMPIQTSHEEQLREIIRGAVYSSLHAHENYDRLTSAKEFVNSVRVFIPRYYKPAKLIDNLAWRSGTEL